MNTFISNIEELQTLAIILKILEDDEKAAENTSRSWLMAIILSSWQDPASRGEISC